jgi:hypothetical protein
MGTLDWAVKTIFQGKDMISQSIKAAQKSTGQFEDAAKKSFKGAEGAADSFRNKLHLIGNMGAGVFLGNMLTKGAEAGARALRSLVDSVPEYTNRIDALGKSAQKIGLPVESFQKLSWAAELANVSGEQLTGVFNTLNKNLGSGSLVKFLNENNRALAAQVKGARSNEEVFYSLADAIAQEADIGRRAALGNAAFGKSWADLVPMIAEGSDAVKAAADSIPDLVSSDSRPPAGTWNDTWSEITRTFRGFADTVREALVQYVVPYVVRLKEWIKENRELIKTKIQDFIQGMVEGIKRLIPVVQTGLKFIRDWGPAILGAYVAFKTFQTAAAIIDGVSLSINALKAAQGAASIATGAMTAATNTATISQLALNAAAAAFPVAIIAAGAIALWKLADNAAKAYNQIETAVPGASGYNNMNPRRQRAMWEEYNAKRGRDADWRPTDADPQEFERDSRGAFALKEGGKVGLKETVTDSGDDMSDFEKQFLELQRQIAGNTGATTDAVNGLGGSGKNIPGRLNYAQMGQEDIFSIVRAGL